MENFFENGAIVNRGYLYEKTMYNVSNQNISVCFDSTGAVTYYAEANKTQCIQFCFVNYYKNGEHIDMFSHRTVNMLGRRQTISIKTDCADIICDQFLDAYSNGVFMHFRIANNLNNTEIEVAYRFNDTTLLKMLSDGAVHRVDENESFYFTIPASKEGIKIFLTLKDFEDTNFDIKTAFDRALKNVEVELNSIKIPQGLNDMQKAMFLSCYYCALENYKEKDHYKGFMAGHRYLLPMRTYYRDSYYTVLPMYNGHADKVRNEIITLCKGIRPNNTCPSAVNSDYSAFWDEHFDSPSFFVIMLFDYIKNTGDISLLSEPMGSSTVLEKAEAILLKLSESEDETGLIYKEGELNKRDWADEVNRYGYVTYNEVLYARAWYSLAKLYSLMENTSKAEEYTSKYELTKKAINNVLWDESKGYYVNFKNRDYTEDNLSVDTVFAAIWKIADKERAVRMLQNMENTLECKNNPQIKVADFGVMTVYPFYKKITSAYRKSSEPLNYHNGANWPYLSAIYAYAKRQYGMEYQNALESWFTYNIDKNNFTPIEYFSSACPDGSLLQAWSGTAAFVMDKVLSLGFWD